MTTPAAETKKRRSREETRQRLLDAGLTVFAHNGYERATVDEIVREAGFSKGAFYVHFEAKEDLFWELLQERIDRQQEMFRAAVDPDLGVEVNERRLLEAVFNMRDAEPLSPAIFLEFAAHGMRNEKVRDLLAEMYTRWHAFTVEMLEEGRARGLVREDIETSVLASALLAVIEGTLVQSNLAPPAMRLNAHIDQFARLLGEWVAPAERRP
jgi:AcrR family transcriptional regulator